MHSYLKYKNCENVDSVTPFAISNLLRGMTSAHLVDLEYEDHV